MIWSNLYVMTTGERDGRGRSPSRDNGYGDGGNDGGRRNRSPPRADGPPTNKLFCGQLTAELTQGVCMCMHVTLYRVAVARLIVFLCN
jgi:hypothetical protein